MSDSSNNSGGVGILSLTTLAFVILKLTNVIAWSWWWVFSPLWIGFALFLVLLMIVAVVAAFKD
jgi:hypothetical protein